MYVKPSSSTPAAIRKAAYLAKQKADNAAAQAKVVSALAKKV